MNIHIALYRWKESATSRDIRRALENIAALAEKIPDIVEITCAENASKHSQGYTHVILVRAKHSAAMNAYRQHPDHVQAAALIEAMEERGIGVDFSADNAIR